MVDRKGEITTFKVRTTEFNGSQIADLAAVILGIDSPTVVTVFYPAKSRRSTQLRVFRPFVAAAVNGSRPIPEVTIFETSLSDTFKVKPNPEMELSLAQKLREELRRLTS